MQGNRETSPWRDLTSSCCPCRLVDHGFEVTFVNTEVDHALVLGALPADGSPALGGIHLVSIPDGPADDEDRKDLNKLINAYTGGNKDHELRRWRGREGSCSLSRTLSRCLVRERRVYTVPERNCQKNVRIRIFSLLYLAAFSAATVHTHCLHVTCPTNSTNTRQHSSPTAHPIGMAAAAPHVMVLPFPAQGHVTPLMELSHRLVERGFEVTFVCTELTHALLLDALRRTTDGNGGGDPLDGIRLVSVPDGMADGDDRRDLCKFLDRISRCMPGYVEELIRETEESRRTKVKWLIGDASLGLCFEVAKKLGVRVACVWPASAACLVTLFRIPELIEDGFFDDKGFPKRHGTFELAPETPPLCTSQMPWSIDGDPEGQQVAYQMVSQSAQAVSSLAEIIVCNSFRHAETTAFELFPSILPIGPLFDDQELRKPVGQLLPEDARCVRWLDAQPDNSVVYVAFGSFAIFDARQFRELAEGLELTGRPFLWVVRQDFTSGGLSKAWFDEFQNRTADKGMIVSWCAQQQVLAHRAVACFVSHCGWNSTMEGVRNGVPILCWPYFCDQFANRSYICDVWGTGLAVWPGENGVVTKEEVSCKVGQVIGDEGIAERARMLRHAAFGCLSEGGSSYENFNRFVNLLRE